ncbi:MAG: hypothetical protein HZC54_14565 [Verrucomicrobia bacterium]|nr:hypothetical protein [Verrucomicrobiota bacterium]
MTRAAFLVIVAVLCFDNTRLLAAIQREKPPPETQAKLVELWNAAAENMKLSSSFFAAKTTNTICKVDTEVRPREFTPRSPQILIVKGSFVAPVPDDSGSVLPKASRAARYEVDLQLQVRADTLQVLSVLNAALSHKHYSEKDGMHASALSQDAVLKRAGEYLKVFKWDVPPNFKVESVRFNKHHGTWAVTWNRFANQYPWDEEAGQRMGVEFDQTKGLVCIYNCSWFPAPRNLELKVTKEQAIAKAATYVETAQHIAFVSGYVATGVESCALRVAAPRFKPQFFGKKIALEENIPKETRLCWVVLFKLENPKTKNNEFQIAFKRPTIYIDAATRELVGFE